MSCVQVVSSCRLNQVQTNEVKDLHIRTLKNKYKEHGDSDDYKVQRNESQSIIFHFPISFILMGQNFESETFIMQQDF